MDPLSEIIALLRPSTAIAKPITGRGRWAVRYAAHEAPGFTIILDGACWVTFDGEAPLQLRKGDFLLLPSTPAFTLASHPKLRGALRDPMDVPVRHGEQDGAADFRSLGGTFRIEPANAALLIGLLPRRIHIRATPEQGGKLRSVIELIMAECADDAPGRDMTLQRLLEVLLIEALRSSAFAAGDAGTGLLRGLRDPALARALRAAHGDVRARWTIAQLAKIAGLSRSAFAARFGTVMGCAPIEYLARWRMALAKEALTAGTRTLDEIADAIGFDSTSAFSTAFRKRHGCPPGRFARAQHESWTIGQ